MFKSCNWKNFSPQKTLEFIIQLQFHYPASIIINNCDHSVSISYDSEDSRINNITRIASSIIAMVIYLYASYTWIP